MLPAPSSSVSLARVYGGVELHGWFEPHLCVDGSIVLVGMGTVIDRDRDGRVCSVDVVETGCNLVVGPARVSTWTWVRGAIAALWGAR